MKVLRLAKTRRATSGKKSRSGQSARVAAVLDRALRAHDDADLWQKVFVLARDDGDFEIAERAARAMGARASLYLAEIAIARGLPEEAVLLVKDCSEPAARSLLAWAYFCMNHYSKAAALWMTTGNEEELLLGRALSMHSTSGNNSETLDVLRPLCSSRSRLAAAAASKFSAEILARGDDRKKALVWARRAEWLMPFDLSLKRLVAKTAALAENRDLSMDRWKRVLAVNPDDAEAHEVLGRDAMIRDDIPSAIRHFQRALAADPLRANLRVLLGDIARTTGKLPVALDHWETAHRVDPKDRDALMRLAELAWEEGNVPESLEYYLKLKNLGFSSDDDEENFEIIGYLYSEVLLGGESAREKDAKIFFGEALQKFPRNPFLMIYEARRHVSAENHGEARKWIQAALDEAPLMPEALFELGMLAIRDEDWEKGISLLQKAAQLDPDPFYKKELGRNFLEKEDWISAEKCFKKALSSGTDDEEVLLGLYLALFNQGKYSLAENILRRALALAPDNMQMLVYLAETLMLLAKYDAAHAIILRVRKSAITHEEFLAGRGAAKRVVEPLGVVPWLVGFSSAFMGHAADANRHFARAHKVAPQLLEWFGELRAALDKRIKADKAVSRKVLSVIIPEE